MIIVIDGTEAFLIDRKIHELIKGCDNVVRFNGSDNDFSVNALLEACDTSSLFAENTKVLVNEPGFLVKKEKGEDKENDSVEAFENYIDNPNYASDLIIYTYNSNFSKTSKIYKHLILNAQQITLNALDQNNFRNEAMSLLKDYKLNITNEAVERLIDNAAGSTTALISSLDVLKNYPDKIDEKCVDALTTREIDSDIFDLINALVTKDLNKSITLLRGLFKANTSVFMIIAVLAGQLRFLYQVDYYLSKKYSYDEIADILKCKRFRVQKAVSNLAGMSRYQIIDLLSRLSDIDSLNKSDASITPEDRFELYIVKNFRK